MHQIWAITEMLSATLLKSSQQPNLIRMHPVPSTVLDIYRGGKDDVEQGKRDYMELGSS